MKTYKKTSADKMVSAFDRQLMNILKSDLKAVKAKR